MASPVATNHMRSNLDVRLYDHDPDSTDPVDVVWRDIRDVKRILIGFFRTVGTGNVDAFKILANAQANGGGTDVEIKAHALAAQPNAVGDQVWLECSVEEIAAMGAAAGVDLRYVAPNIEFATATDEGVVVIIMEPTVRKDALTADIVA